MIITLAAVTLITSIPIATIHSTGVSIRAFTWAGAIVPIGAATTGIGTVVIPTTHTGVGILTGTMAGAITVIGTIPTTTITTTGMMAVTGMETPVQEIAEAALATMWPASVTATLEQQVR